MKVADIHKVSQQRTLDAKRNQQHIWTVGTCALSAILYWFPIENQLGLQLALVVQYGIMILAGICLLGSIFFSFKAPDSGRRDVIALGSTNNNVFDSSSSKHSSSYSASSSTPSSSTSSLSNTTQWQGISASPGNSKDSQGIAQSSGPSARKMFSPNYRGLGYSDINTLNPEAVHSISHRIWDQRIQNEDEISKTTYQHNGAPKSPFGMPSRPGDPSIYASGGSSKTTPQTKQQSLSSRYVPSPSSEADSPLGWASRIVASGGHPVVKVSYPFAAIGLQDESPVDSWTENLKYIVGKHVRDAVRRFDMVAEMVAQKTVAAAASSQPPRQLDIVELRRLLLLHIPNNERLRQLLSLSRDLRVPELNEYLDLAALFCPLGKSGMKNVNPAMLQRARQLAQSQDGYLRIGSNPELPGGADGILPNRRDIDAKRISEGGVSDADMVVVIFFHLCDTIFGRGRFSADHIVEGTTNIPIHRPSSGASTVQVGIVRSVGEPDSTGPHSASNRISFDVYVVRGPQAFGSSAFDKDSDPEDQYRQLKQMQRMTDDRAGGASSRALFVVPSGRHNSFEAILLFLLQMVRLRQIHISDAVSGGSGIQSLLLEIFSSPSGKDFLSLLKELGVKLE